MSPSSDPLLERELVAFSYGLTVSESPEQDMKVWAGIEAAMTGLAGPPEDAVTLFASAYDALASVHPDAAPAFLTTEGVLVRLAESFLKLGRMDEFREALHQARRRSSDDSPASVRKILERLTAASGPEGGRAALGSQRRRGRPVRPALTREEVQGWIGGREISPRTALLAGPFPDRPHFGVLFVRKGEAAWEFRFLPRRAFKVLRPFFEVAARGREATLLREELETVLSRDGARHPAASALRKAVSEANKVLTALGVGLISEPDGTGVRTLRAGLQLEFRRV